jgi:hypothetical protein
MKLQKNKMETPVDTDGFKQKCRLKPPYAHEDAPLGLAVSAQSFENTPAKLRRLTAIFLGLHTSSSGKSTLNGAN